MQAKQLWQAVLGDMQVRLSRNAFDNWLRPTTIMNPRFVRFNVTFDF